MTSRSLPGLAAALVVALLASMLASPVSAASPDTGTYRFVGYGTDHGVGLNQRGAAGRAKAGQGYAEILAHYFPGTILTRVPVDTTIRALVVRDYKTTRASTVLARGMITPWTIDSPAVTGQVFPVKSALVLVGNGRTGSWTLEVRAGISSTDATLAAFTDEDANLRIRPVPPVSTGDPVGDIEVMIRRTTLYDRYQGTIRIGRKQGRIQVVNEAPIEAFVRSVAPRELGPGNLMETLKTQAVAARSYFLAGLTPKNRWFDVQSIRDSQSYLGIKGENDTVNRAVDATAYEVLKFKGTIARTFYHAVGGGATEASANVFTGPTGTPGSKTNYLMGGPDVDERGIPYDIGAPDYAWSSRTFTLAQLSAILAQDPRTNVGTLTSWPIETEAAFHATRTADQSGVAPRNRGVSGRLTWLVLKGSDGTKQVAGWLFKSVFNAHRGAGDGVGSTMIFLQPITN